MKLRNLDFGGHVFAQSGLQGFFGEGDEYPHHLWYKILFGLFGFSFKDIVFVAKTGTLNPRIYPETSNTELRDGYKIKDFFPSSIWWSFKSIWNGYLLNAVGLANPGIEQLLKYYKWQKRNDVFQLSVMLMEPTLEKKILEVKEICRLFWKYFPELDHQCAIQINFSCPNTGHEQKLMVHEYIEILKAFRQSLPQAVLIPKFDLLVEPETIVALKEYCDAFCISNSIPFLKKEPRLWWIQLFGGDVSPLVEQLKRKSEGKIKMDFSGGLSGLPLFPVLVGWINEMEKVDPTVSIIAGGGIARKANILLLSKFKIVKGVALGSIAILRPCRMRGLIRYGNKIFAAR